MLMQYEGKQNYVDQMAEGCAGRVEINIVVIQIEFTTSRLFFFRLILKNGPNDDDVRSLLHDVFRI